MSTYKIVETLDNDYKVVINAGKNSDIKVGNQFLIYQFSEQEIIDPDTSESLGFLEIVKGTGKVVHVQDKMSTIESNMYEVSQPTKIIRTKNPAFSAFGITEEQQSSSRDHIPFDSPSIGDFAKQI